MKKNTKKKSKKKIIALTSVGVVAAVGGLALYGSAMGSKAEQDADGSGSTTAVVEKMDLRQKVTVSGTVASADQTSVNCDVVGAKVKSVKVKVGDRVKKGDIIAELDDTKLKESLADAQRSLDSAKSVNDISLKAAQRGYDDAVADKDTKSARSSRGMDEAQNEYDKAVKDQTAAYDDYNAAVSTRETAEQTAAEAAETAAEAAVGVSELKGTVKTAKTAADAASAEFDRLALKTETTAEEIEAAKKARDEAKAAYDDANDAYTTAQAELSKLNEYSALCAQDVSSAILREKELYAGLATADKMVDQARLGTENASDTKSDTDREYDKMIAQNRDALDTAKLNLDESLSAPQKQVDDIEEEIEKCVIKAPCDGVITSLSVNEGDTYTGGEIVLIQDDSGFKICASVDQYDISKISKDMDAEITVQAIGAEGMDGKLSFVSPTPAPAEMSADGSVSTTDYPIEATLADPDDALRIGMSAKLVIVTEEKKDVFAVPDNCLQKDSKGWYITVQKEENETEILYVDKGLTTDYYTEISGKDVKEGMEIITPEDDTDSGSVFY